MAVTRLAVVALAALSLSACTLLKPRVVKEYVTVEVERIRYVEVEPELTDQHPIAEGPLSACPDVAAKRKEQLRLCNIDKAAIRAIEGQPRPSPESPPAD